MVEMFASEKEDFDEDRLRIHKSPVECRFADCQTKTWYLSDRKMAFHDRKTKSEPEWKYPSSCPNHRASSTIASIDAKVRQCPKSGKRTSDSQKQAELFRDAKQLKQFVYQCPECDGWHLTSMNPEQRAELEKPNGNLAAALAPTLDASA